MVRGFTRFLSSKAPYSIAINKCSISNLWCICLGGWKFSVFFASFHFWRIIIFFTFLFSPFSLPPNIQGISLLSHSLSSPVEVVLPQDCHFYFLQLQASSFRFHSNKCSDLTSLRPIFRISLLPAAYFICTGSTLSPCFSLLLST